MSYFAAIAFCLTVNGATEKCSTPKVRREEYSTELQCKDATDEYLPYYKKAMQDGMAQAHSLLSDLRVSYQCLPASEAAKLPRYPAS